MPKNKDYKKPEKQIRHIRVCKQIFELIDLYYVMKELENISNSELIFEALTNCQQVSTMKAYCDFIMIIKEYKPEIQEDIMNRILQIEDEDDLPEIIKFIKEETFKNSTLQSQKELINKNFLIDRTKFLN